MAHQTQEQEAGRTLYIALLEDEIEYARQELGWLSAARLSSVEALRKRAAEALRHLDDMDARRS